MVQDRVSDIVAPLGTEFEKVFAEAKERHKHAKDANTYATRNWLEDWKFFNADSFNGYQWPNQLRKNRDVDARPCLTINKARQHCLQIINDAKQNKPAVTIRPTGNGATFESAQVLEGIVRHIEYVSNASTAYDTATTHQVAGGCGWIRVTTDYMAPNSFDQEIYIRRVDDPLTILVDPETKEADKSDMRFAFVYDEMSKEVFKKKYPKWKDQANQMPMGDESGWLTGDMVRIAEYWRKKETKDTLFQSPAGPLYKSQIDKDMALALDADPNVRQRETNRVEIEWFLIIGAKVVQRRTWPGKYIPLVPVIGEETLIEGNLDRKGHVRALLDAQRMYNYWTSAAVEFVALQGKSPYIAPAEAIEGKQQYWNTANRVNYSVLTYNGFNDAGEPIPPPQRQEPPQMAPAYITGMQVAAQELMYASGQYQAQMGEQGNERSGKAIMERQRQGDNATYHFIDNLGVAIRHLGKILLDLIPKVYDVPRVMMILAEDGTDLQIQLDQGAAKAYQEKLNEDNKVAQRIFNPNVGEYEVQADIGPAYATRREQAFEALMQIMTQAPATTSIIGDILFKSADFPMADEAAMRLRRMVPPQATGDGPSQQEQQLQMQVQQLQGAMGKLMQDLAESRLENKALRGDTKIKEYDAETKRATAVWDHEMNAASLQQAEAQLGADMAATGGPENPLEAGQNGNGGAQSPGGGAGGQGSTPGLPKNLQNPQQLPMGTFKGRDGHYYHRDMTRGGKYLAEG